jgi:hypothetical protein
MRPFNFGPESPVKQSIFQQNSQAELTAYNNLSHPSKNLSREHTTDVQRQNINVHTDLAADIDKYLREIELENDTSGCLVNH